MISDDELIREENLALERYRRRLKNNAFDLKSGTTAGASQQANTKLFLTREKRRASIEAALDDNQLLYGRILSKDQKGLLDLRVGKLTIYGQGNNVEVADWRAPIAKHFFLPEDAQRDHYLMSAAFGFNRGKIEEVEVSFGREHISKERPSRLVRSGVSPENSAKVRTQRTTQTAVGSNKVQYSSVEGGRFASTQPAIPPAPTLEPTAGQVEMAIDYPVRVPKTLSTALKRRRTGRMGDHISTLQPDQFRIISFDSGSSMIVTGGPGTGKSVVAVHRALFLQGPQKAMVRSLIVAPSDNYAYHIKDLMNDGALREGDSYAEVITMDHLYRSVIEEFEGMTFGSGRLEKQAQANFHMSDGFQNAVRDFVWSHASLQAIELRVKNLLVRVEVSDLTSLVEGMRALGEPYGSGQIQLKNLIHSAFWAVSEGSDERYRYGEDPLEILDDEIRSREVLDAVFPPIRRFSKLSREFLRNQMVGGRYLLPYFTPEDVASYYTGAASLKEAFSNSEIAVLATMVLEVNGNPGRYKHFGHVVVDEVQDLSVVDLKMIRRISDGAIYTIAGDLNQTSTGNGITDLGDIEHLLNVPEIHHFSLDLSFRVPRGIARFTESLRCEIGLAPNQLLFSNSVDNVLDNDGVYFVRSSHRRSVVACVEEFLKETEVSGITSIITIPENIGVLRRGFKVSGVPYCSRLEELSLSNDRVMITTSSDVRGLEFDNVIVINPSLMLDSSEGLRSLFRAVTRATRKVCFVDDELDHRLKPFIMAQI